MTATAEAVFASEPAVAVLDAWLCSALSAQSLTPVQLERYRSHMPVAGWRLAFIAEGQTITIDLLVDRRFPAAPPRVCWVDPPPFPSLPHVERDGSICTLPSAAATDPLDWRNLVQRILGDVETVIGQGLRGENLGDFRTEFRSYWNEVATGRDLISLVDPCGPSRMVRAWFGRSSIVLAEDRTSLRNWLGNAFDKKAVADLSIHAVPLLWLPQPPLPGEYPRSASDLAALAAAAGPEAAALYNRAAAEDVDTSLFLLGSEIESAGICLGGVSLSRRRSRFGGSERRFDGFRKAVPAKLLLHARDCDQLHLCAVRRVDPWWVHGRDSQSELETLLGATVAMVGCGSLGSITARLLAQAGVGELVLLDPEIMAAANASRHALGLESIGANKAEALRGQLARAFPHLRFTALPVGWQDAVDQDPGWLARCDLVVSTVGDWQAESALNAYCLSSRPKGVAVYGWAEPHAVGGHAVAIGPGSGCFACGLTRFGSAAFRVADFAGATLRREPACGAFFQPYGGAAIASVATLVARLVIDLLYETAAAGDHRVLAVSMVDIAAAGGTLSAAWNTASPDPAAGNQLARHWPVRANCPYCAGKGA